MVFISQIGKSKKGKRGSIKILQTTVNGLMMEMKVRWWKSQDLYQPLVVAGGDEQKKFKRDRHGDGPAGPFSIRMLGAPKGCCEGTCWGFSLRTMARRVPWIDDVQVTHFEELEIKLHSYESFTTDGIPPLELFDNVSGEIGNSFFLHKTYATGR